MSLLQGLNLRDVAVLANHALARTLHPLNSLLNDRDLRSLTLHPLTHSRGYADVAILLRGNLFCLGIGIELRFSPKYILLNNDVRVSIATTF